MQHTGDEMSDTVMPAAGTVVPSAGFQYYQDRYWNDFSCVVEILNERATGSSSTPWYRHLRDEFGPFRHALVLNCGNGWVERDLLQHGVIESAVGVDVSEELVDVARRIAEEGDLPLRYQVLDTNTAEFPDEPFDIVVNHAALHHIAYLDRVLRRVAAMLPDYGVLASWDYVGPHRNQYTAGQWDAAWQANSALPAHLRQKMVYPHLPTMLAGDPTEAIHSELILPTIERYFDIEHRRDVGGGVGYLLLTHNSALHALDEAEAEPFVRQVMEADAALLEADPSSTLFSYLVARPDRTAQTDPVRLERWAQEEDDREQRAVADGGVYYPRTSIASLTEALIGLGVPHDQVETVSHEELLAHTPGRVMARALVQRAIARGKLSARRLVDACIPTRR